MDSPYQLDPFTEVVDINFGTGKFLLLFGADVPFGGVVAPSGLVTASFPGIEGGTPGFQLIAGTAKFPNALPVAGPGAGITVRLTAKVLAGQKLISLAGQAFKGFALQENTSGDPAHDAITTAVYIPLTDRLAKQFDVTQFAAAGSHENLTMGIGLYGKNVIKAGSTTSTAVVPSPTVFQDIFVVSGSSQSFTWHVDPEKLTIS